MSHLEDIYQEVIIDHSKSPRNFGVLKEHNRFADGVNPLCGDKIRVYLNVNAGVVQQVHFEGTGCAISVASASLMTAAVKGLSIEASLELFNYFHAMIAGPSDDVDPQMAQTLGKLQVFGGIRRFPSRVKCAVLAWYTLRNALKNTNETAKTE